MRKLPVLGLLLGLSLLLSACQTPATPSDSELSNVQATIVQPPAEAPTATAAPTDPPTATADAGQSDTSTAAEPAAEPDPLSVDPNRPGFTLDGSPTVGAADAPVISIEFSDFQCPFCRRHVLETEPKLKETLVADGTVRMIFKHYPLPSHERADDAAEAAECAAQQDKFWEMKELLFEENASWGAVADLPARFEEYAAQLGLDTATFGACLDSGAGRQRWQDDAALGQSAGVTGTPTFFIFNPTTGQGTRLPGFVEYDQLAEIINQVLTAPPVGE